MMPLKNIKISQQDLIAARKHRVSITELARKYNCHRRTFLRNLTQNHGIKNYCHRTKSKLKTVIVSQKDIDNLVAGEISFIKLQSKYGVCPKTMHRSLAEQKVRWRQSRPKKNLKISKQDQIKYHNGEISLVKICLKYKTGYTVAKRILGFKDRKSAEWIKYHKQVYDLRENNTYKEISKIIRKTRAYAYMVVSEYKTWLESNNATRTN